MALVVKDRVQETSTTTGTGTFTLAGAVSGFQSFSVIGNANTTYYAIVGDTEWEVGIGTYTSSGTTLSRDTVLESSNSGSLVNFSAGTKNVFVTYPAEKSVDLDTAQTLTNKTISGADNTISNINLASQVTGTLGVSNGGTGQTTANSALNALLPSQTSNSGKYLTTDGTNSSWATVASGVTSFQTSLSGLTPSTATTGAVTLAGTLGVTSGGTGTSTAFTQGSIVFAGASGVYSQNNANLFWDNTNSRMTINGSIGIGATPSGNGLLELAAGTTTVAPIEFTSGTNLTTPLAGAVEYDGTIMTATSNTNFKRGTIPLTNYTSGTGITLGTNTEATLQRLLPAANDTITLSIGTYFFDTQFIVTRGASTTSATTRLNILGAGTAAGTFSAMGFSFINISGSPSGFAFNAVNINVTNVVSAASTTSGGLYYVQLRGILKITSSGTIIPQYNLSVNINGAGTVSNVWYFRLQQLDTQSAAAFGPAGTGWA